MNSREAFEKWLEKGGDGVGLEGVRAAIAFEGANPAEATAMRRRHEQRHREIADQADALAAWIASGRDPKDFDKHYRELKVEADSSELREMTFGARDAARRSFNRSF